MSATKELWVAEYEQIFDDYTADCIADDSAAGVWEARDRVARRLKALGFDLLEVREQLLQLDA